MTLARFCSEQASQLACKNGGNSQNVAFGHAFVAFGHEIVIPISSGIWLTEVLCC
jgi:hypothetical protein